MCSYGQEKVVLDTLEWCHIELILKYEIENIKKDIKELEKKDIKKEMKEENLDYHERYIKTYETILKKINKQRK